MLKIQEIREIIKLIDQSSIESFTYEADGEKIKLKKGGVQQAPAAAQTHIPQAPVTSVEPVQDMKPAPIEQEQAPVKQEQQEPAQPAAADLNDESLHKISSPMVGTFYSSSSPEAPAYVKAGDKVEAESIVCIVEAMKLFNEIEAEVSGEIVEILVKDGQLVEYGQPLFLVKAN